MAKALANRWNKRTRNRILGFLPKYREQNRRNEERMEKDFHILMTQGPARLMERMLQSEGIGNIEIQRALNDTQFVNNFEALVTSTLLRRRWERRKLSKADARRMAETAWGVRMIQQGFARDAFVAERLKELSQNGKLKGNLAEWMSNHSDAEIAAVLAASAGAIAAAGLTLGPPAIAAVGTAAEKAGAAVAGAKAALGLEAALEQTGGTTIPGPGPSAFQKIRQGVDKITN